jgi:tripartite-type tricarboxylate transporter receptor subunit TctC
VLSTPDMQSRFAPLGADISTMPGANFDAYIKQEIAKFREIAKLANIEPT